MASASSNLSDARLRVNFQAIKPTIPISARPPQTDIPTIEPVPSPLLPPPASASGEELGVGEDDDDETGTVIITVTLLPSAAVLSIWEIVSLGGALVGLLEVLGGGVEVGVATELVEEVVDDVEEVSGAGVETGCVVEDEVGKSGV